MLSFFRTQVQGESIDTNLHSTVTRDRADCFNSSNQTLLWYAIQGWLNSKRWGGNKFQPSKWETWTVWKQKYSMLTAKDSTVYYAPDNKPLNKRSLFPTSVSSQFFPLEQKLWICQKLHWYSRDIKEPRSFGLTGTFCRLEHLCLTIYLVSRQRNHLGLKSRNSDSSSVQPIRHLAWDDAIWPECSTLLRWCLNVCAHIFSAQLKNPQSWIES